MPLTYGFYFSLVSLMLLGVIMEFLCPKALKKIMLIFLIGLFLVFAALRSNSVPDTNAYIEYFEKINRDFSYGQFEIGFQIISVIISLFTNNYKVYFFVIALLNVLIVLLCFKNCRYTLLPMIAFISYHGFYFSFMTLRVGLAILLGLSLFTIFYKKNCLFKMVVMALALSIHTSMIIFIPVYVVVSFTKKNISTKQNFAWLAFFTLFYFFAGINLFIPLLESLKEMDIFNSIYFQKFFQYVDRIYSAPFEVSRRYLLLLVIYLITNYHINKIEVLKENRNLCKIQRLIFFGLVIKCFFSNGVLAGRLSVMFDIFIVVDILVLVYIFEQILSNNLKKQHPIVDNMLQNTGQGYIEVLNSQCTQKIKRSARAILFLLVTVLLNAVFIFNIMVV